MSRNSDHDYLIMDTADAPLGTGKRVSPPNSPQLQVEVLDGNIDNVEGHDSIKLLSLTGAPPQICRVLRIRGDRVILDPQSTITTDMRRNLRVPVRFDSLLYPVTGRWRGSRPAQSIDLSCGGVAFRSEPGLEIGEILEIVVLTVEAPLILRGEILRQRDLEDGSVFSATKFLDLCEDEEMLLRETVFSIQLNNRPLM